MRVTALAYRHGDRPPLAPDMLVQVAQPGRIGQLENGFSADSMKSRHKAPSKASTYQCSSLRFQPPAALHEPAGNALPKGTKFSVQRFFASYTANIILCRIVVISLHHLTVQNGSGPISLQNHRLIRWEYHGMPATKDRCAPAPAISARCVHVLFSRYRPPVAT